MDDLAVARGNAGSDGAFRLGHNHLMAAAGGRAGHGQTDHAGSDHQDLHAALCLVCGFGQEGFIKSSLNHHLPKNRS